jgi:antibiotic biosynthesis monooxygenase (ABM) superfamily enzyme
MILYVQKWDILPEKLESYNQWATSAIKRSLDVPGVVEFRAYRPCTGLHQAVITWEFADMSSWSSWYENQEVQKVRTELQTFTSNRHDELWGPSPIVPEPIRPANRL